jgi:hypothetical protein
LPATTSECLQLPHCRRPSPIRRATRPLPPPQGVTGYPAANLDRGKQRLEQEGTEKTEEELHFSVCSVPSAFLLQSRRDDPKPAQGGANASAASVCATLGNVATEIHSPNGAALNCRRNERSPWQMIEPSFPPSLRATPSGFRCGQSSHPRVARTLVSLTCAPPCASIGLCLRHGRSLGAFTNETPAQPAECSTLHSTCGNIAFPGGGGARTDP